MGLTLTAGSNDGKDFAPHPSGQYQAVCIDMIDHGTVTTEWNGETRKRHLCQMVYETNCDKRTDGSPWLIWTKKFTASLHEKATLRSYLEAWRGQPFTETEQKGFDSETLLGVNAILQIVHREYQGKPMASINAIMKPMNGMPWIEQSKKPDGSLYYTRVKDRTPAVVATSNGNHGEPARTDAEYPGDDEDESGMPF